MRVSAIVTERLLQGPVLSTLLRLAAPNMAEAAARASFITLDAYFVGWLGGEALAGVALVFPFFILMQTMAAGGMGGGVSSAIARALGAGRRDAADALVVHAVVIATVMAALFTAGLLGGGRFFYEAMGGRGQALEAALVYSTVVFSGAIAVWMTNTLANVVRGTGRMGVPAAAIVAGEVVHVALSPILVLGWGPIPQLGVAGAGVAVVASYVAGSLILALYLVSGRALVGLTRRGCQLRRERFAEILKVGGPSSINTIQFQAINLIVVGFVGQFGIATLAGYGAALRIELVQVPIVFGFGTALVAMVGANVGAGQLERARRIAWAGAALGALVSGSIGLLGAGLAPTLMRFFSEEPEVVAVGVSYLRTVGPVYAFFGIGLALFFACQGAGRVTWPFLAVTGRLVVVGLGGWAAVQISRGSPELLFVVIAASLVLFGLAVFGVVKARVAW